MNRRRLDFEATRDALAAVAGQLDLTMGGQSADLTGRPFTRRRTLYGYIDRLNLPSMYRVFDFASPDTHSPQRHDTLAPQQSLFLMNHPFVIELARQLAEHPDVVASDTPQVRIEALYRRIFARSATPEEIALALPLVRGPVDEQVTPLPSWSYGVATFNETGQIKEFSTLPFFTHETWHTGPQLPELKCGWASLTAGGGTPPRESGHAVVRRWTAPEAGTIEIEGTIRHTVDQGDGIRARIIHSRLGELASWTLHKLDASGTLKGLRVDPGETIDFVVDGRNDSTSDAFQWAPIVRMEVPGKEGAASVRHQWEAQRDFSGPADPLLSPWARYVQVLLQSNEFVTID
jgi:hypothetical protein